MTRANDQPANGSPTRSFAVGVCFAIGAAVLWSLNGALIKLAFADGGGPPAISIAFYRSLIAGLVLWPLGFGRFKTLLRQRNRGDHADKPRAFPFRLPESLTRLRGAAVMCCVFFAGMTVCFVTANTQTEAANAIILQYTSTFWVFLLSPWILAEKANRQDLVYLVLAMVGILVIFLGNALRADAATSFMGLVLALGAGLFYGLLTLMIRRLRDADAACVTVFNCLGSALLIAPAVWWFDAWTMSGSSWLYVLLLGAVQFGLPYYFYSLGLARVPAFYVALITLIEPVLVPLWTYLTIGERVPVMTAVGGAFILAALILFLRTTRQGRARTLPEAAAP